MKNFNIKNPILESVYNYYTNKKNYLKETINEEGYCIEVDDTMFNDIIDMIETGTYAENEPGHILIPTEGGYTLNIEPNGEIYLDDERGNEMEATIDPQKLSQIMNLIKSKDYKLVSENKNNPFTNVKQDPESGFIKFTKKDNVSQDDAMNAAHNAVEKAKARRASEKEDDDQPSKEDKLAKSKEYWQNRRDNMAEPHGYGTSGTRQMQFNESTDEGDVYDPAAVKPDIAQDGLPTGLVNEARLSEIVREIIKNKLK